MRTIKLHGEWVDILEDGERMTKEEVMTYQRGLWISHGISNQDVQRFVSTIEHWWKTVKYPNNININHAPLLLWPSKHIIPEPKENEYGEVTP